ncbi:hypothetical protein TNCV_3784341 [Trichonephila clavipes]|nr:hypothetical protein TNCV_3784341 [Trichonephila clavipes]
MVKWQGRHPSWHLLLLTAMSEQWENVHCSPTRRTPGFEPMARHHQPVVRDEDYSTDIAAAVAEWSRYWIVAGFVTNSSPVPLKTRRVGTRCTLNLSRAQTPSRWCGS